MLKRLFLAALALSVLAPAGAALADGGAFAPYGGAYVNYGAFDAYGLNGPQGYDRYGVYGQYPWPPHHQIGFYGVVDRNALAMAATRPWHANYYNTEAGRPLPLVVPPTANMETRWGWGVSQSTMTPIYHQFQRPYPGPGGGVRGGMYGGFRATPYYPSHTDQFGTYYVRGPW